MTNAYLQIFESIFFENFGKDVEIQDFTVVASGSVNSGVKLRTKTDVYFIKINELEPNGFFKSEASDLSLLKPFVKVPEAFGFGKVLGHNYLLSQFIEMGEAKSQTFSKAGRQLAKLHLSGNPKFGLDYNNYLSSVLQDNRWKTDGINFLIQNRILPMVGTCLMEEKISIDLYKGIENLCGRLGKIIPEEAPALLHGDLWSGNLVSDIAGDPYFIDPSCYYGLRESELAFTHLFGGFDASFYESYLEIYPLQPGFGERVSVYHIHPLLVHVYLFGSGYIAGIERILKRFS